jgi:hypothetical protein
MFMTLYAVLISYVDRNFITNVLLKTLMPNFKVVSYMTLFAVGTVLNSVIVQLLMFLIHMVLMDITDAAQ